MILPGSTTQYNNLQMLQEYLIDCQTAVAARTGAGDGGNPNLPNDQTNDPEFLSECQQYFAITECLGIGSNELELRLWLFSQPQIREELGGYILQNGCGSPNTCGSSSEAITLQRGWLDYRRFETNNDPISFKNYQMKYGAVCDKTEGISIDRIKLLNELRRLELEYFGEVTLSKFGELAEAAVIGDCWTGVLSHNCVLENYSLFKHDELLAKYPNYSSEGVTIDDFIAQFGAKRFLASAAMFEAYMEEVDEMPEDPYQWQLAMEVFRDELLPLLAEFTPGVGDLIGAYNDFQAGSYFWGCVSILSTIVPGDEIIKIIRKSDNIRDAWKTVKALFRVWNKLFPLAGTQKVFNHLPQAWKNLPGSKLANNKKGLKWVKDTGHHFRIAEANPSSQWPSQHVPYSKFFKNGSYRDINMNPVANQSAESHIAIDDITDSFLTSFFN